LSGIDKVIMPKKNNSEDLSRELLERKMHRDDLCTPEQKRHQAREGYQRFTEEEKREPHSLQYRSGFALDAPWLLRADMPAYLREDRPPFYAFIPKDQAPELHPLLEHQTVATNLGHPTKGVIRVLVPQNAGPEERLLLHEEYHAGTNRVYSRDYSCGPLTRAVAQHLGTFDGDEEEMAWSAYVLRQFYDAQGTRVIAARVLADTAILDDRRDLFPYAYVYESTTDGRENRETAVWLRKGNALTARSFYNDEGARRSIEYSNGMKAMYTGPYGNERMVTMTRDPAVSSGVVREFYAGPPGCAYLTRQVYQDGTIKFFAGTTPNFVHLSKVWHPDGRTELYSGDWRGVALVGTGYEPRDGEQTIEPTPGLVRAVLAICDGFEREAPQEELAGLAKQLAEVAPADRISEVIASNEDDPEAAWATLAARAFAAGGGDNPDPRACVLSHFLGSSPARAAEIIQVHEGVQSATAVCAAKFEQHAPRDPANQAHMDVLEGELAASFKIMTDNGVSKEDAQRVLDEFLTDADAKARAMCAAGVSGPTVGPEEVERITRRLAHATMNKALATVRPATEQGAASANGATPAPQGDLDKVMRIGTSHPRTDLHGKRVKILSRAGKLRAGEREIEFLDAPVPKPPKGATRWVVLTTDLVKEAEWLAARSAKQAERAAKAESDKARRRANKLARQLESDAKLAAELQEEEKAAVLAAAAAPPGPPPEGQRPLREQLRCPIDGALLEDAVLASDGYVYNKSSLQAHWTTKEALVSPVTGATMTSVLCRHNPIRSVVKELIAAPDKGQGVPADEPDLVLCPISQEVMQEPVLAEDGNLYDRATLAQWFATGATTSPMTNTAMGQQVLADRHAAILCAAWRA